MRWVVYALLGVNLALLAWNLQREGVSQAATAPEPAQRSPSGDEANPFPLLSELDAGALRPRVRGSAKPVEQAAPGSATEAPGGNTAPDPIAAARQQDDDAGAAQASRCFTLGPLAEDAPFERITGWLTEHGAEVDVRHNERREVVLHWIYFPPYPTYSAATARMEELLAQGLDDVIVVRKGDMSNAVSLGVFSRSDTRNRRLRQLNALGHQPSIAPRYRARTASWIDVTSPADAIDRDALRKAFPRYEPADKPCSDAQIAAGPTDSYNPTEEPPGAQRRYFYSDQQRQTSADAR